VKRGFGIKVVPQSSKLVMTGSSPSIRSNSTHNVGIYKMKKLLSFLCFLFLSGSICADEVVVFTAKTDSYEAVMYNSQCSNEGVLSITGPVPAEVKDKVKNGSVTFANGEKKGFCWFDEEDGYVFVIDEDGNQGEIQVKK
jgi:hypothetical protein